MAHLLRKLKYCQNTPCTHWWSPHHPVEDFRSQVVFVRAEWCICRWSQKMTIRYNYQPFRMKRLWTGCSAAKPRWVRDSAVWWVLRYSVFGTRTECHSMTHATTRWSAAAVFVFWYFPSELPIYGWVILNSWPLPGRNLLQVAIDNTRSLSWHVQTIHHSFQLPLKSPVMT